MAVALLGVAGCGGSAPQTSLDAGDPSSGGGTGGNGSAADGGTSDGGASDGGTAPACSPAGAVRCSGDGDGDGKGDGDVIECNPSYGWVSQHSCRWTCQNGACGVCALEKQSCRYSSDCQQSGFGLVTCIEVGGSDPCGLRGNGADCICVYNGYALACVESMECAPGYYCAPDGVCRPGCYPKNEPCFSDDQCCSGTCKLSPDQCSGDCL